MILLAVLLISLTFVSAEGCSPQVSLINQDPYPAIPGEYVKLVFQVNNLANSECQNFVFELLEKYPLIFDPNTNPEFRVNRGFYEKDYDSFLIAPYKVRIDSAALEGDNPIETKYFFGNQESFVSNEFEVYVEDSRAKFELHIDKYSYATKELTIEILNIADIDVEALTIEINKQDNIKISGSNRIVVGDLDSNEYTTADFNAIPKDGEIEIRIIYTDQIGVRRELMENINFDSSYFEGTKVSNNPSFWTWVIILVVLGGGIWWFIQRRKKIEARKKRQNHHHAKLR